MKKVIVLKFEEPEIKVIKDTTYPTMFRLKWPDGTLSADMYNLTRAKEHARNIKEG